MTLFHELWKDMFHAEHFAKADKLSKSELVEMQNLIARLQKRGLPSSKIITALQKANGKLIERWRAERVFWTESKREDTVKVGAAAEELDFDKYRVILSPHPCQKCIEKTQGGRRVFKTEDLEKGGYGHVPPFHPNCYCVLIPLS